MDATKSNRVKMDRSERDTILIVYQVSSESLTLSDDHGVGLQMGGQDVVSWPNGRKYEVLEPARSTPK